MEIGKPSLTQLKLEVVLLELDQLLEQEGENFARTCSIDLVPETHCLSAFFDVVVKVAVCALISKLGHFGTRLAL